MSSGWEEVQSGSQNTRENIFFTPKTGKNIIRLVKEPHKFLRHFNFKNEVCLKSHRDDSTYCPLCEVDDKPPSIRYMIMILDRADQDDNGVSKVKIYEAGSQVFGKFKTYMEVRNVDPGSSQEGPDFVVIKTVAVPNDAFSTSYDVVALDPTPFTNAEKKVIKEKLNQIDLDSFHKQKSVEELRIIAGADMDEDDIELDDDIDLSEDVDDADDDLDGLDTIISKSLEEEDEEESTDLGF